MHQFKKWRSTDSPVGGMPQPAICDLWVFIARVASDFQFDLKLA